MPMTANGLAKLLEELGELSQISAKKLAYYHTDSHPDGKGSLNRRLEEEMGDVLGAIDFVVIQFKLNANFISLRASNKFRLYEKWHSETGNDGNSFDSNQPSP